MTKDYLLKALKWAKGKNQTGIFIWNDWKIWDELDSLFHKSESNSKLYKNVVNNLAKDEPMKIPVKYIGFALPGILVIPIDKALNSEDFLNEVVEICNKSNYKGPITLFPSTEIFHESKVQVC